MTITPDLVASAGLAGAAVLVWTSRRDRVRRRLATVLGTARRTRTEPVRDSGVRGRGFAAAGAGIAVTAVVGLPWGAIAGVIVAVVLTVMLGRMEPARVRRRRERLAADLPIAVDLLGACLRSGGTHADAMQAVARAVGGPLGEALSGVVALLRLGGEPARSWAALSVDPELAPLARAAARAAATGAPLAVALEQLAADARDTRRANLEETARKVGVRAAAPLGLCFLPAFMVLGVVPVVAGIVQQVHLW